MVRRRIVAGLGAAAMAVGLWAGVAGAHEPTPTGNQGCTPGFWKNNLIAWESTAPNVYDPNQTLGSVFANVPAQYADKTLLEALNFPGYLGADARLLKHATAALLNASHFDVAYQVGNDAVIKFFVAIVLKFGTAEQKDELKNVFDAWNNGVGGCPLAANVDY